MKCKNCGTLVDRTGAFCPECGSATNGNEKKPFLSKTRILLLSLASLTIISLFVLYQFAANSFTPETAAEKLKTAVIENDAEALAAILTSETDEWAIKEDDAQALLAYLEDNQNDRTYLLETIDRHAEIHNKEDGNTNAIVERTMEAPHAALALKQSGKRWMIFDDYAVVVTPGYISVKVNEDNASLFLNGNEEVLSSEANEEYIIGPLGPGKHEVRGILPSRYMDIEEEVNVQLFNIRGEAASVPINFNVGVVSASTIYDETDLYINGEPTDIILGTNAAEVGLLPLDGNASFVVEREFPWGTATPGNFPYKAIISI